MMLRIAASCGLFLLALGCDAAKAPAPEVEPSPELPFETPGEPLPDAPIPTPDDTVPIGRAPHDPPLPTWPNDLRLLDARRTIAREQPVVWLKFEATQPDPEAAARRITTLLLQSDPEARTAVSASPDRSTATAQIRGKLVLAALRAWTEQGRVLVELLAERP